MTKLHVVLVCVLVMAWVPGCSSRKAVSLQGELLKREHVSVGVALSRAGPPEVRDWEAGYWYSWPFFSPGPGSGQADVFSEKGNESEAVQRQAIPPGASGPLRQGEHASLAPQLSAAGTGALREAAQRFAEAVRRPGWRVAALDLAVDKVDRDAPYLKGLDALVVLDYPWYGAFCSDVPRKGDLSEGGADLTGRMIDLSTGKLLWRSPKIEIRKPLRCGCGDPGCADVIARGMREAVLEAQEAALKDFTGRTP